MSTPAAEMNSPTHRSFTPGKDRRRDLRDAFGRFGTGVTIVTARGSGGPVGMTANSFSSVSLDPPLVLWSPALDSGRYEVFALAAHFCIHVLSSAQSHLALTFAERGDGFDRCDWSSNAAQVPVLADCLAVFHCSTHAVHPAGDHALILGKVEQVEMDARDRPGLLFERSVFGRFAPLDDQ